MKSAGDMRNGSNVLIGDANLDGNVYSGEFDRCQFFYAGSALPSDWTQ